MQKNPHTEVSKLEFSEMVELAKISFEKTVSRMNVISCSTDRRRQEKHWRHFMQH